LARRPSRCRRKQRRNCHSSLARVRLLAITDAPARLTRCAGVGRRIRNKIGDWPALIQGDGGGHSLNSALSKPKRMNMHSRCPLALLCIAVLTFASLCGFAHPGSGIVVDAQGNVFVSDINRGLLNDRGVDPMCEPLRALDGIAPIRQRLNSSPRSRMRRSCSAS